MCKSNQPIILFIRPRTRAAPFPVLAQNMENIGYKARHRNIIEYFCISLCLTEIFWNLSSSWNVLLSYWTVFRLISAVLQHRRDEFYREEKKIRSNVINSSLMEFGHVWKIYRPRILPNNEQKANRVLWQFESYSGQWNQNVYLVLNWYHFQNIWRKVLA